MGVSRCAILVVLAAACNKSTPDPPVPSNRVDVAVETSPPVRSDTFEGTIGGHHFAIEIGGGKLIGADRAAHTFEVGDGRVVVEDSGPVADDTQFRVARSPRTIVRASDGLWIVTERVTTAGGRVFTCLHQQPIARDGSPEAKRATARGVAACTSLRVDPE